MIKTGRKQAPDISDNERVRYGQNAEEYIRRIYQLKNKDIFDVQYQGDVVMQNREHPELLYSPDGLLIEKETGRRGILEIKTSTILRTIDREKWDHQIPPNYYDQVLHGMNVLGFDFVELYAELTHDEDYSQLRRYHIERDEVLDDMNALEEGVLDFMEYVKNDEEPPLRISL
jgi:predicted phage-related endonuclease